MMQHSGKITAFLAALTLNALMLVGVAYLFNGQLHHAPATALAELLGRVTQSAG